MTNTRDKTKTYLFDGKEVKLHGIFQYSFVLEPSGMNGGHDGGVVAYPVAVIEMSDGSITNVKPHELKKENENG